MKRLILTILFVIFGISLAGCVSVTRHEHVRNVVVPGYKQNMPIPPERPAHQHGHDNIARPHHPRGR
jgi:hypothetical protein